MNPQPKPEPRVKKKKGLSRMPRCKDCGHGHRYHVSKAEGAPYCTVGPWCSCSLYQPVRGKRQKAKTPFSMVKERFWDALAAYVKERDGDGCWACGAVGLIGSNNHASHLFNAGNHSAIRYHPDNIHPTCGRCNVWLRGNIAPYAATFIE